MSTHSTTHLNIGSMHPGASPPATMSTSPVPLSPASSNGAMNSSQTLPSDASTGPVRRKTSRRANTAERRATHNAVERQRRETLNSRFLDLAMLLPNLASVRRPSKSAIVNSSIALIHTQRRARSLAARELRALTAETDAIRRELNEWRDRAGMQRVDEPARSSEFVALMQLEDASPAEEEEIRRAYEMASIPIGDEDDDGYVGEVSQFSEQQAVVMPHGMSHSVPQPAPAHIQRMHLPQHPGAVQHAPAQPAMHDLQAQLHAAALMQRPNVHIPAFDGPTIFPGPGHHHQAQTPISANSLMAGNLFQQYNSNSASPNAVNGSPPGSAHSHFAPVPGPAQSYARVSAQFAYNPHPTRDDDCLSSASSGGGSPPATTLFDQPPQQAPVVPTLTAGATPADFARFWAPNNNGQNAKMVQTGFHPMGFAM